ncbi:MAG: flavin reductase family protein [Acidimicrobiia bacterium]|nr:flavin reductase family protein [Acidimicrobiia bacterium]
MEPVDGYKLLIGLVVPRAIGWIGTRNSHGVSNLAPFSFFTAVAATPPTVMFSTVRPGGREKDTLANVRETGVFTVNVVTEEVVERMNATSATVAQDVDEFELAGVTAVEASVVAAPSVAEAKAVLECTVVDTVDVGQPPMGATMVLGRVERFHVESELLDGTRIDQEALRAVGRMGGPLYTRTRDMFGMARPD